MCTPPPHPSLPHAPPPFPQACPSLPHNMCYTPHFTPTCILISSLLQELPSVHSHMPHLHQHASLFLHSPSLCSHMHRTFFTLTCMLYTLSLPLPGHLLVFPSAEDIRPGFVSGHRLSQLTDSLNLVKGIVPRDLLIYFFLHQSPSSGHLIHWLQAYPSCLKILRALHFLEFFPVESHNADLKNFVRENCFQQIF